MKNKYIDTREGGYRFRVTNILLNSLFFINHQLDLVFVTKASKHEEEEEEERKKNNQQVRTHQYATEL